MADKKKIEDMVPRDRLGLCLSGGGFRAAFFHVGVLYRLAELDMLRRIEVISCVSGGAIVGAAYQMLLIRKIKEVVRNCDKKHEYIELKKEHYKEIVRELRSSLACLSARHLVAFMFYNPAILFRIILPGYTLSDALADLIDKYLFARFSKDGKSPRLSELGIVPGDYGVHDPEAPEVQEDPASYNRRVLSSCPEAAAATRLILNATSLNSGSRFWFASDEVGEWKLGYVHEDDTDELKSWCKEKGCCPSLPEDIADAARHLGISLGRLDNIVLGQLRLIRRAAKALLKFNENKHLKYIAGRTRDEHERLLAGELAAATHNYRDTVHEWLKQLSSSQQTRLFEYIDALYLWRSVVSVSPSAGEVLKNWTVARTVVASANFPPIFPPLRTRGIYRNYRANILGLTDGGVYDNLGSMGVLNEDCNYVIVSDAGRKSRVKKQIKPGRLLYMLRITGILGDKGERAATVRLLDLHVASSAVGRVADRQNSDINLEMAGRDLHGVGIFRMDSPMVAEQVKASALDKSEVPFTKMLTRIRTNLDVFNVVEQQILMRHGMAALDLYFRRWFCFSKKLPTWEVSPDRELRFSGGERIDAKAVCELLPSHLQARYLGCEGYPFKSITELPAAGFAKDDALFKPVKERGIVNAVLRVANKQVGRVPCALLNIVLEPDVSKRIRLKALAAFVLLVGLGLVLVGALLWGIWSAGTSPVLPVWTEIEELIPVSKIMKQTWFKFAVAGLLSTIVALPICRDCLRLSLEREYGLLAGSKTKTCADVRELEWLAKRELSIKKGFCLIVDAFIFVVILFLLLWLANGHYVGLVIVFLLLALAVILFAGFSILEARCLDYVIGTRADGSDMK